MNDDETNVRIVWYCILRLSLSLYNRKHAFENAALLWILYYYASNPINIKTIIIIIHVWHCWGLRHRSVHNVMLVPPKFNGNLETWPWPSWDRTEGVILDIVWLVSYVRYTAVSGLSCRWARGSVWFALQGRTRFVFQWHYRRWHDGRAWWLPPWIYVRH